MRMERTEPSVISRLLRVTALVEDALLVLILAAMVGLAATQIVLRNLFDRRNKRPRIPHGGVLAGRGGSFHRGPKTPALLNQVPITKLQLVVPEPPMLRVWTFLAPSTW